MIGPSNCVSARFRLFGATVAVGCGFNAEDNRRGGYAAVVLSDGWPLLPAERRWIAVRLAIDTLEKCPQQISPR